MSERDDKIKELLEQGNTFYNIRQGKKAIEVLLKAIELNPKQEEKAEILALIGDIYLDYELLYGLQMWKEAIHAYLQCIELMPNSFVYHEKLGKAYNCNQQYEKAIEVLLKAIELNPKQEEKAEIFYFIGDIYQECYLLYSWEVMEKAIQAYLKCIELVPDSLVYLERLGGAYNQNKQYEEAIKIFLKLIELDPNFEPHWSNLAFSCSRECSKALLRCAELEPMDNLSWLGQSYEFNAQYKEAIQTYLKLIELAPNDTNGIIKLGNAYYENRQYKEAIESFLEAIKLNPDDYKIYILLGDACVKNGQYKDAIKVFEKVIELLKKS